MPFYYPNWINDFWRIMGLIHYGDKDRFCIVGGKRFDETAIREFCLREGLAFYDTACEVRRLRDNAFGCAVPQIGGSVDLEIAGRSIRFWRMPSTSRAYPLPLPQKAEYYRQLWKGVQSLDL